VQSSGSVFVGNSGLGSGLNEGSSR
jgi:hypothetical protein